MSYMRVVRIHIILNGIGAFLCTELRSFWHWSGACPVLFLTVPFFLSFLFFLVLFHLSGSRYDVAIMAMRWPVSE